MAPVLEPNGIGSNWQSNSIVGNILVVTFFFIFMTMIDLS